MKSRAAGKVDDAFLFLYNSWKNTYFQAEVSTSKDMIEYVSSERECFSAILIAALLQDCGNLLPKVLFSYVDSMLSPDGVFFFENHNLLPADVDCTAFALIAMKNYVAPSRIFALLEKIAGNTTEEGIIRVYFDAPESRNNIIDPVVCANALYSLNLYCPNCENRFTEDFIYDVLATEKYIHGTRYYPEPITFLWAVSRLMRFNRLRNRLFDLLRAKISHFERPVYSLGLAQYITVLQNTHRPCIEQKQLLASWQQKNGSWEAHALFKYGKKQLYFGSSEISTAFSIYALVNERYL